VLGAVMMVMLFAFVAFAIDIGFISLTRAQLQNNADAAALAAAQELAAPTGSAPGSLAAEYAERNGATLVECSCEAGATEAVVAVEVQVGPMLLVPGDRSVTGRARAVIAFPQAGA